MISRTTLRKSFKWFAAILFLVGAGAGSYGYWLWYHCDEYLLQLIIAKQQELAPDWDVKIGRAHFDWHRRIHIYNVTIKARGQNHTIATIPEIVVAIDREKFQQRQEIDIQSVHALHPAVELRRTAAGAWNWHALMTLKPSRKSLPEWTIEGGVLRLIYEQANGNDPTRISLSESKLHLIPSGKRQFKLQGKAEFNDSGKVSVRGDWLVDARRWSIQGQLNDIQQSDQLLQLAAGAKPLLREKLLAFSKDLENTRAALTDPNASRVAMNDVDEFVLPQEHPSIPTSSVPDFGLESKVDVSFRVAQVEVGQEWQFQMGIHLKQGTLSHPVLPFPLRGVAGDVLWNNSRMEFRNLSAQNGTTRVTLNGYLDRGEPHASGKLKVELANLLLDRRLRSRLPASFREPYDMLGPSGPADVSLTYERSLGGLWKPTAFSLEAKGCGAIHRKFPYPITDITGSMRQRGERLVLDFVGQAGGRPIEISGSVQTPGPSAETSVEVRVRQFPLDDRFRQSCPREVKDVLRQMNLNGWADVELSLFRPPGLNQPYITRIGANLLNCEVLLDAFPYRVTKLHGAVAYRSDQKSWAFTDLSGEHGTTKLSAEGTYRQAVAPGVLDMTITTKAAAFDDSLFRALPDSVKTVWHNFSPSGKLDAVSKIRWIPDLGFKWSLPKAEIYDARMTLKSFPYSLSKVRASLSYDGDLCEISSFSARHGDTRIRGRGNAFLPEQGRWVVNLLELFVDDLSPDRQFRQALPSGVRTVVEELDPQKPFSLSGGIRLSGTDQDVDPVVASWNLKYVFTGNQISTGVELKNVFGQVTSRGIWNGITADCRGRIELASVDILGYQITEASGPYEIKGNKIIVGSADVLRNQDASLIPLSERLSAEAIDGTLTYDAEILLDKDVRYRSRLNLIDGSLEEYAKRYLPGTKNLSGVMNGWLNLSGQGVDTRQMTGAGRLRISPAALYELPILAQVFQVLTLNGPDRTAFRLAEVDFDISKNQFVFNSIDLVGESLILRGLGSAGFDGRLNIDFYSMLPRARLPWPVANLVNPVLDQATKDWVRVEVRGKTSRADVKLKPVPVVDDTIKRFLGVLGTGMSSDFGTFPSPRISSGGTRRRR